MDYLSAVVLGAVEGITEFLPVSSTGHLLIAESILGCHKSDAFNVLIQVGPILAAALVFWKDILRLLTGLKEAAVRREFLLLTASFFLTCGFCFVAKKLGMDLPDRVLPIALATLIGGFVIFAIERHVRGKTLTDVAGWGIAIAVALAQLMAAVLPGTSRSGAAVLVALVLGMSRPAAVRFAFLVGIPTMFAAGGYEMLREIKAGHGAELIAPDALLAFGVATATAWLAVVWLLRFVRTNTFNAFAWYRVGLGLVLIAWVALGVLE